MGRQREVTAMVGSLPNPPCFVLAIFPAIARTKHGRAACKRAATLQHSYLPEHGLAPPRVCDQIGL
eukprot:6959766-Pyramimonas_sp.AAC.1